MRKSQAWVSVGLMWVLLSSCQKGFFLKPDGWGGDEGRSEPGSRTLYRSVSADEASLRSQESKLEGESPSAPEDSMGQPKKRVLVVDFKNDSPVVSETLGPFMAEELRHALVASEKVMVPEEIKSSFSTADFVQGDQIKVAQLVREGRKLGVAAVMIGRITKIMLRQKGSSDVGLFKEKQFLAAVDVEAKLFDVQSGRELLALARTAEVTSSNLSLFEEQQSGGAGAREELIQGALSQAATHLVSEVVRVLEKMTWQGRIAKVIGNRVYVNAGRSSGLQPGDILKVFSSGEDIYDPGSGAYLGRAKGQIKGTLEVKDYLGADGSVTEIHTGGNFREDDVVQLY
ncbi:MAG: hypothetical protein ACO3A2_10630 [Bdellovibrionia bacterium]